jgi:hypothetical protein
MTSEKLCKEFGNSSFSNAMKDANLTAALKPYTPANMMYGNYSNKA